MGIFKAAYFDKFRLGNVHLFDYNRGLILGYVELSLISKNFEFHQLKQSNIASSWPSWVNLLWLRYQQ